MISILTVLVVAAAPSGLSGVAENPLITRYAGSVLQNASSEHYASLRVPEGPGRFGKNSALEFEKSSTVEGQLDAYFYVVPKGRTALEVFRNYQSALAKAGFTNLYQCEMQACDQALIKEHYAHESVDTRKWADHGPGPYSSISRDVRFISAKHHETHVVLYVAEPNSVWEAATAVVIVIEPALLETGKIIVDSQVMSQGLATEGKIALYGLYFDIGKADLRPDSKPQLTEMAKVLGATAHPKVFIVGHTDNFGSLDDNLALSLKRAQTVVAALTKEFKIDPKQLSPRGVAQLAPLASNVTDAGRAKNRRVELVAQ